MGTESFSDLSNVKKAVGVVGLKFSFSNVAAHLLPGGGSMASRFSKMGSYRASLRSLW